MGVLNVGKISAARIDRKTMQKIPKCAKGVLQHLVQHDFEYMGINARMASGGTLDPRPGLHNGEIYQLLQVVVDGTKLVPFGAVPRILTRGYLAPHLWFARPRGTKSSKGFLRQNI